MDSLLCIAHEVKLMSQLKDFFGKSSSDLQGTDVSDSVNWPIAGRAPSVTAWGLKLITNFKSSSIFRLGNYKQYIMVESQL